MVSEQPCPFIKMTKSYREAMTGSSDKEGSSTEVTSNEESRLSRSNNPSTSSTIGSEATVFPITGHKLSQKNYIQWSKSVMMYIHGKWKDEYLIGDGATPGPEQPNYKT